MFETVVVAALAVLGVLVVLDTLVLGYLASQFQVILQVLQKLISTETLVAEKLTFMDRYLVQVGTIVGNGLEEGPATTSSDPMVQELLKKISDLDLQRNQPSSPDDVKRLEQLFRDRIEDEDQPGEDEEPPEPWKSNGP